MIFGVDPSTTRIGWCLFDNDRNEVLAYDVHKVTGKTFDHKLADIARSFDYRLEPRHMMGADTFAIEVPVYHKNVSTTIKLAQVVGVLRYAAFEWSSRTIEINPGKRLAAFGLPIKTPREQAKRRIVALVNAQFGTSLTDDEHDAADAIAVAVAAGQVLRREAMFVGV